MPLTSPRFTANVRLQKAAENAPPMRAGERGEAVGILQQALVDLGFRMPRSFANGQPDGIYGEETTTTVWQFQDREKLSRDGVAGHDTWARLDQLFAGGPSQAGLRFEETHPGSGLDSSRVPPAMLIPAGTHALLTLRNGDGAALSSDNMGVAQATRGLLPERVAIFGRSAGTTQVVAAKGSSTAKLDVIVKRRRIIKLSFFVVTDKNNISPLFSNRRDGLGSIDRMNEIDRMVAEANQIYRPQTNIVFEVLKKQAITIHLDLDPLTLPDHEQTIAGRIDAAADHTLFFVRNVVSRETAGRSINAVTKIGGRWSLLSNKANAMTLAHEMAHSKACGSFGLNHDPANRNQLLFCGATRTGTKITIDQANRMNP